MLGTWNVQHEYCNPCRSLHSERGDLPACERGTKEFMSRLESLNTNSEMPTLKVDAEFCEVIQDQPFQLMPENNFVFKLISMAHSLGNRQKMEFTKHNKQYVSYLPTLTAIDKALEFLHPEEWEHDDLLLELEKVFIIHNSIVSKHIN